MVDIIQPFQNIRDIPFRIPLSTHEQDNSCSGKRIQIKSLWEHEGYEVRCRVCEFLRSDLPLPSEIVTLTQNLSTHVYLEVKIGEKLVIVDPTRDRGLQHVLPVNSDRDGRFDMQIAVKPTKPYLIERSHEIMTSFSKANIQADVKQNGKFYEALNEWLAETRKR